MRTEIYNGEEVVRCQDCPAWKPHKNGVTGRCRDLKQGSLCIDYCEVSKISERWKK